MPPPRGRHCLPALQWPHDIAGLASYSPGLNMQVLCQMCRADQAAARTKLGEQGGDGAARHKLQEDVQVLLSLSVPCAGPRHIEFNAYLSGEASHEQNNGAAGAGGVSHEQAMLSSSAYSRTTHTG